MDGRSSIEFGIEPITATILGVTVQVNGVDLRTLAGGGMLVGAETLHSRHWAGHAHPAFAPDPDFCDDNDQPLDRRGAIAVLNCDCGILDCGGLFARVRRLPHEVRWTDFRRAMGSPGGLEEMRFDERQYFGALRVAKDHLSSVVPARSGRAGS